MTRVEIMETMECVTLFGRGQECHLTFWTGSALYLLYRFPKQP